MEIRKGIPVSPGYAIGEAFVLSHEEYVLPRRLVSDSETHSEITRLKKAQQSAIQELQGHIGKLSKKLTGVTLKIIESHLAMLQDPQLVEEIVQAIQKNRYAAEYAVTKTIKHKLKLMSEYGDAFFAQRVEQDFTDIEKILIRNLLGATREDLSNLKKKVILVAHDLTPTQTATLDKDKILGILTDVGGRTSHSAIIASSIGIPAVVGLQSITTDVSGGDRVVLDGNTGTVIVNPDENTVKRYTAMERNFDILEKRLTQELKLLPAETKDGYHVDIFANIETPDEIPSVLAHGAEGIGLYRTEFLYLVNKFQPTEKDQIDAYRKALTQMGDRKLIIRTLDIGADKMPLDGMPKENNPFMGMRAIRLCLQQLDLFRTQLRAIYKVSSQGNIGIMFPMISTYDEIVRVKEVVEEVKKELRQQGASFNEKTEIGIMIEVPSAALIVDHLIQEVDFLSIGTNDLIAYSMAVDRLNQQVASLYQPAHPAILRLLKQVIEAGNKAGKKVSLCGEMSSDVVYTLLLLGMGLKVFSVVPPAIPEIKKIIRSVKISEAREIAEKSFTFPTARDTVEYLKDVTKKILPDVF